MATFFYDHYTTPRPVWNGHEHVYVRSNTKVFQISEYHPVSWKTIGEMREWCVDSFGPEREPDRHWHFYKRQSPWKCGFQFEYNDADAALFKMRWCDDLRS